MRLLWIRRSVVVIVLGLALVAGVSRVGIIEHDFGMYTATRAGASLTDSTLSAALVNIAAASGSATRRLLIPPGTWNIANNLTIPANIGLHVAPGAILNVAGGKTLTINGTLEAPMAQIFIGTGIVLGPRIHEIHAQWWGTACDGIQNDQPFIQAAINASVGSGRKTVMVPPGRCRILSPLTLQPLSSLKGYGMHTSILEPCGAGVRGVVFEPSVLTGFDGSLENFGIWGCEPGTTVGDLLSIKNTGRIYLRNLTLRNTAGTGLRTRDLVIEMDVRNVFVAEFLQHGMFIEDANTVSLDGASIQNNFPSLTGLKMNRVSFSRVVHSTFEGYGTVSPTGPFLGLIGWELTAVGSTRFEDNFVEFYRNAIVANGVPLNNIVFDTNHLHDAACNTAPPNVTLDLSPGGLIHDGITIERNLFVACAGDINIAAGATINLKFAHNLKNGPGGAMSDITWDPVNVTSSASPTLMHGGLKITPNRNAANTDGVLTRFISWSDTLDFGSTAPHSCDEIGMGGMVGVAEADPCFVGAPVAAWSAAGGPFPTVSFACYVSAADGGSGGSIAVKRCNAGTTTAPNLAPATFKVTVIQSTMP